MNGATVRTLTGREGFRFLDERELGLRNRWFHYSTPEVFAHQFASPDWLRWKDGDFEAAVRTMLGLQTKTDRARSWQKNGVRVTRVQAVDAASLKEPGSALNYLLTYLAATHPDEDRLIVDADVCAAKGVELPDIDFLIHDDDVVFTKYEGEPSVVYRDAYFNTAPEPGQDDDRPFFRYCADAADTLLARREEIAYRGELFGVELRRRLGAT
jgi:hypothetical protein